LRLMDITLKKLLVRNSISPKVEKETVEKTLKATNSFHKLIDQSFENLDLTHNKIPISRKEKIGCLDRRRSFNGYDFPVQLVGIEEEFRHRKSF